MRVFFSKLLSLLLGGSYLIGLADSQYNCNFSEELSIHKDGSTFLQQYINAEEGTFTMRIRYTGGRSWIGIGISTSGKGKMAPGYAVIGDIYRGIMLYDLQSDDKQGSGVIPMKDTNGHLKSPSFVQTEAGESILEFTHDLIIRDPNNGSVIHEISASSVWIWAVGLPDNAWAGKHKLHGAFDGFELFNGCVKQAVVDIVPPASPPTTETTDPTMDGVLDNENPSKPADDQFQDNKFKYPEYSEDFTLNQTNPMPDDVKTYPNSDYKTNIGHDDGKTEPKSDDKYPEEINVDTTTTESGQTALVPNTTMGSPSTASQNISFLGSDSEATRALWVAHGLFMGIAWGIFAPLAIGAAYLRNNFGFLKDNARWLKIHFYFSGLTAFFTIVGFALAVSATKKDDDIPHFDEDDHHKAGLAIFLLVIFQGFAGYYRPSPVQKRPSSNETTNQPDSASNSTSSPVSFPASTPTRYPIDELSFDDVEQFTESLPGIVVSQQQSSNVDTVIKAKAVPSTTNKNAFFVRRLWEYGHRLLGIILLSLSWYNCHSGIVLQAENYDQDDEGSLLGIFWGITGFIAGSIVFVGYVLRLPAVP
mmetsp:Transcript_10259/g.24026  ORF Transcript_10259/g.24026 Transcript_10259/m.24026 type:complete len:589 (+) Transcript_10259:96-1862(+)